MEPIKIKTLNDEIIEINEFKDLTEFILKTSMFFDKVAKEESPIKVTEEQMNWLRSTLKILADHLHYSTVKIKKEKIIEGKTPCPYKHDDDDTKNCRYKPSFCSGMKKFFCSEIGKKKATRKRLINETEEQKEEDAHMLVRLTELTTALTILYYDSTRYMNGIITKEELKEKAKNISKKHNIFLDFKF